MANSSRLEDRSFLLLLAVVSLGFFWVLWPYYGAVFWGAVLAILFNTLFISLLRKMPKKRTLAALLTLSIILVLVILPVGLVSAMLTQEAASMYQRVQSGELSFSRYFQQIYSALPSWVTSILNRSGLDNLVLIQQRVTSSLTQGSQFIATQAVSIGQNAFDFFVSFFIMLYLLFFFLRDGGALSRRIKEAIPLEAEIKLQLFSKFTTVIRATVKGNIVVAVVQGILGGLILWFLDIHAPILWGTLMAFLSLLPAIGAAIVWIPVAIYFLATGAIWQGVLLIAYGVLVIGLVDNILRPVLVGKDTKMPDYVVLVSTIGGMSLFGLNGFVIGPVIGAMFMAAWDIFVKSRHEKPVELPPA
ncbi:putative PurR-regulated permease PerM [Polaromonas sp. CG_9.7]|nr:AI-2E family transporter [Polaromonas sp. CG_9.7]MBG6073395.1 putative PurR-regulated permease PerM [Polaromonas sp. CG_9.7]MDH6186116.1 putative PurR-regulated permease PerM [Polaromonas sp. CG_23.6]